MAEENSSEVKKIENFLDTNPPAMSEEDSVETVLVKDVENVGDVVSVASTKDQEECIPEMKKVPKPQVGNLRRHSTGAIGTRAGKPQVQSRYRGNHHVSSTHEFCKHGKKCDQEDAVKPWKIVRRKSVEGSEAAKSMTSSLTRKTLASLSRPIPVITKPESFVAAKRRQCASVKSESSSVKEDSEMARSIDGSSVKSNDKAWKNKETERNLSGSAVVKKVPGVRSDKSKTDMEKVSRIRDGVSSKNKEKAMRSEDVKEKTVCVVESSVKGVQREKQPSSEKKTLRIADKSLTTPKRGSADHSPTKQIPAKISTRLTKKKESGSADLEAKPKPEKKISPKRTGVKVTLAKQLSFKKGKTLDPKPEDSSPKWIKLRKRVVQELKTQMEGRKKTLRDKRLGVETKTDSCEGIKREKVVLRHRQVEGKKKKMTLFNNVIEETMNKLTKVRKTKVKALIGAFETVISLQDTKTPQKVQSKATTSASKVSPMGSEQ
ncbi:hypothetical protein EUTSA_v10005353mg [Eutrema salsugineum]|uniref:Calmodulin-binding domain-containing protein n=1 Tax=Eutrema salsugineum TaxID=72664 RepID=V4KKR4_EUTSA|nr:nucleolar and coiled-body phosphoprotein 1 [Eutrema salsugineum]ESQ31809.1 hypothetical protein EUTSA_v10005353mg [Eutrema salsugineum]